MAEVENTTPWYSVERKLLPVKGIYFTIYAAIGSLYPFIPLVMKQMGFSVLQLGFLYGSMHIVAFFIKHFIETLADKSRRHKLVLIVLTLLTGLSYCLLSVVPDIEMISVKTQLQCSQNESYIQDCQTVEHRKSCNIGLTKLMELSKDTGISCEALCAPRSSSEHLQICFTNGIGTYGDETCKAWWNEFDSRYSDQVRFTIENLGNGILVEDSEQHVNDNNDKCKTLDLKNATYTGTSYKRILCSVKSVLDCEIKCGDGFKQTCSHFIGTAWMFFVIFLCFHIFYAPTMSLINALSSVIVAENHGRLDQQLVWGTVSFAMFALISTFIMDVMSKPSSKTDYSISIYIFGAFCVITAFVTFFTHTSQSIYCRHRFGNIHYLIRYPALIGPLVLIVCFGIMNSVTEVFLFWYLHNLGSTHVIMGLCLGINSALDVVLMFYAGWIVKKIGNIHCLYLALLAYAVRLFGYSFVTVPLYVLPLELLHGLSFRLIFAATTSYASLIMPPERILIVPELINTLYFVFGKGIGSLLTGDLFDSQSGLGAVWTFRFYGFCALGLLILYAIVHTLFFSKIQKRRETPQETDEQPELEDNGDEPDGDAALTSGDRLLTVDVANDGVAVDTNIVTTDDVDNSTTEF